MINYEGYSKIRDSKGLRDSDVAKRAGIQPSTFSEWKKGKCTPKYEKMFKIAAALDMDYRDFVGTYGLWDDLNPNRPDRLAASNARRNDKVAFEEELIRLYYGATEDAQTSVITLLKNSQREKSSDSLKEA